jgi:hypothetical protein
MGAIINLLEESIKRKILIMGRRNGNTTRMVDLAIQLLFEGNMVIVEDHSMTDYKYNVMNTIISRLQCEHFKSEERYKKYVNESRRLNHNREIEISLSINLDLL